MHRSLQHQFPKKSNTQRRKIRHALTKRTLHKTVSSSVLNLKINLTGMNSVTGNSPLRKKLGKSKIIDLCGNSKPKMAFKLWINFAKMNCVRLIKFYVWINKLISFESSQIGIKFATWNMWCLNGAILSKNNYNNLKQCDCKYRFWHIGSFSVHWYTRSYGTRQP